MKRPSPRRRSLAAWISSCTFCCCCLFPQQTPEQRAAREAQRIAAVEARKANAERNRLALEEQKLAAAEERARKAEERQAKADAEKVRLEEEARPKPATPAERERDAYLDAIAPEVRRKEICFAYGWALDQSRLTSEWIAADKAGDRAVQMKDIKEMNRQLEIKEKIDRAYLKKIVFDPFRITFTQAVGVMEEGSRKGWHRR